MIHHQPNTTYSGWITNVVNDPDVHYRQSSLLPIHLYVSQSSQLTTVTAKMRSRLRKQ